MDLQTVTSIRAARDRADLHGLDASTVVLAGGSWLFSEPSVHLRGLVDLTTLDWPSLTVSGAGLSVAATCTLAEIAALPSAPGWRAHPLFFQCCTAMVGSYKIWNVATVGGNLVTALPAGPMTSLTAALDGVAVIWKLDGSDLQVPVADFVTGNRRTVLGPGDVLRSVEIPFSSLGSRTAYRKIALAPLGRSGAVLIGRLDSDETFVLTVTAATTRPVQLRFAALPDRHALTGAMSAITDWFTDAHGAADWRRAVSTVLALEILEELSTPAVNPVSESARADRPDDQVAPHQDSGHDGQDIGHPDHGHQKHHDHHDHHDQEGG